MRCPRAEGPLSPVDRGRGSTRRVPIHQGAWKGAFSELRADVVLGKLGGVAGLPTNRRPATLRPAPKAEEVAVQKITSTKATIGAMTTAP